MKQLVTLLFTAAALTATSASWADVATAQKLADKYAAIAKNVDPNFAGPSVEEGKKFFNREVIQFKGAKTGSKVIACASCHTANPADSGKHIVTGKPIRPLSPAVNAKRFTDIEHVEKQFTKHCNEVVGGDCSPQEKANYITFLISENTPSKH